MIGVRQGVWERGEDEEDDSEMLWDDAGREEGGFGSDGTDSRILRERWLRVSPTIVTYF